MISSGVCFIGASLCILIAMLTFSAIREDNCIWLGRAKPLSYGLGYLFLIMAVIFIDAGIYYWVSIT